MAKKSEGDKVAQLRRMREANHSVRAKKASEAERGKTAKQALTKKTKGISHE